MSAPFRPSLSTPPNEWHIALTHGDTSPAPGCQPIVLQLSVYRDEDEARAGRFGTYDHAEHRGACWGCDWLGPDRLDEQEATEDAHDHAFPGWRDLPALEPLAYDASPAVIRQARRLAELTYPSGWRERCGPTVSWHSAQRNTGDGRRRRHGRLPGRRVRHSDGSHQQ